MATPPVLLRILLLASLLGAGGCVEPYTPELAASTSNLLVVNGYLNSQGVSTITLSRSLLPTATQAPPTESRAQVSIRSEAGTSLPLSEGAAGTYTSGSLTLNPSLRYRLHITTSEGREYESDLSPVKNAPPIDQVHWRYEDAAAGVRILVDSHDDSRASTYYRWQFVGTWQFTSLYRADLQYNPATHMAEPRPDDIYHCWRTESSTTIEQTSTAGLAKDAVLDYPLTFLPVNSEQLRYKYSVLVRLFTETQDEYDYWELLRRNSQNLGSLNDPLPSQVKGNVHCLTDASETVLGYVGVHGASEQRIFISSKEVPQVALVAPDLSAYADCQIVQEDFCPEVIDPNSPCTPPAHAPHYTAEFGTPYFLIIDLVGGRYLRGSTPACVDCRLRGTNVKPSFWP